MDLKLSNLLKRIYEIAGTFAADYRKNRKVEPEGPYILILRDSYSGYNSTYYHHFLSWVESKYPGAFRYFKYGRAHPCFPRYALDNAGLVVFWIRYDSIRKNGRLYRLVKKIEHDCDARGIPYVNPVSGISNTVKTVFSSIASKAGIRAAKMTRITRDTGFNYIKDKLGIPFFIRDDFEHGANSYHLLVNSADDLEKVEWNKIESPVAVEFIDVRSDDGYYRKYRTFSIGEYTVFRHLIISENWFVHATDRINTREAIDEEMSCILNYNGQYRQELNRLRKALNLDYVAFDYSIDRNGELVVWEPNHTPGIWPYSHVDKYNEHQLPAVYNVYRTMLIYYLENCGLENLKQELLSVSGT